MTTRADEPEIPAENDPLDRIIDSVLNAAPGRAQIPGAEFNDALLRSYDEVQRRRRKGLSLAAFADATGWRILARPIAAATALGSICAAGFVAGATAPPDAAAYAEISSALDQSFVLSEENDL